MQKLVFYLCLAVLLGACQGAKNSSEAFQRPSLSETLALKNSMQRFTTVLEGDFSNEAQHKSDNRYAHVMLHVRRIWKERSDAHWYYLEQYPFGLPEEPYVQTVFGVQTMGPDSLRLSRYNIPNERDYLGAWEQKKPLRDIRPSDLSALPSCDVFLKKAERTHFVGSTKGSDCRYFFLVDGADYSVTRMDISYEALQLDTEMFNEEGKKVFGQETEAYIYEPIVPASE